MGESTPRGYPYPVGTDRVTDGDNAIQDLAETVDAHLGASASGILSFVTTGGPPSVDAIAVTFPAGRFTTPPRVFMQQASQLPQAAGQYSSVFPLSITAIGFSANCRRYADATVTAYWFAVSVDT